MHGVRQWWVRLSILHKAIVLSCAFVIPILLVVGLLVNDFYDYREKSDDILSEYARCTDYMNAMEQENALLGELTFAAPESDTIDKYADAVQDTASAWERLRSAETDGSTQSEVLKQVIDRTMKSYRVRQEMFIAQLHDGSLLLSPREGGGSLLHFTLAHLPDTLADHNLRAPMILEDGYPLEEVEFSIFD